MNSPKNSNGSQGNLNKRWDVKTMKDTDTKAQFIELRAKGMSYGAIAKELKISKSTCSSWNYQLSREISANKNENLDALYKEYGMAREARIKRLGKTLLKIDKAIDEADFRGVSPDRLLELKLKYIDRLNQEYKEPLFSNEFDEFT